jgi:guanyl-specific ribonuclease Sa
MRRNGWILVVLVLLGSWAWHGHRVAPAGADATASASVAGGDSAGIERPGRAPRDDVATAARASDGDAGRWTAVLPPDARETLALIEAGGPFPYRQDGATFQNREHRLPERERGYYREYTVDTPGSPDRGARRIIAGGDPPSEFFYTDDHYGSFRRFTASDASDSGSGGAR